MKIIVTIHSEIGYNNNVEIVENALCQHFGFNDQSGMPLTLAQHVWSYICVGHSALEKDGKKWGLVEINSALASLQVRVSNMQSHFDLLAKTQEAA